jgi:integrase
MLTRRCEEAGIDHIGWHAFRHRFAHQWLAKGGQEGDLARLGGWSDPGVMRRYGSALATERALDAYDELGGVL